MAPTAAFVLPVVLFSAIVPNVASFALLGVVLIPVHFQDDRLDFTLPTSARQVRVARLLAALCLRWSPFLFWLAFTARRSTNEPLRIAPLSFVAMGFAIAILPEAIDRWTRRLLPSRRFLIGILWSLALVNVLIFVPELARGVMIWTVVAVSVVAAAVEVLSPPDTPLSLRLQPRIDAATVAAPNGDRPDSRVPRAGEGLGLRDYSRAIFALFNRGQQLVVLLMVLLVSFPRTQLFLAISLIGSNLLVPLGRMAWLATLPIPTRNRVALYAAVPCTVMMIMLVMQQLPFHYFRGYLGMGAPLPHDSRGVYWDSPSRLPLTYWTKVSASDPITIRAPWGETAIADTTSALGQLYMNPFTVNRTSSDRFRDWQRALMTKAVYGRELSANALRSGSRYQRATETWRMLLMQGAILFSWFLVVVAASVLRPSMSYLASLAPLSFMAADLARGYDRGEVWVPLLQRWLLSVDAALPNGIFVIALAALPVCIALGLLWLATARGDAHRQLRYAATYYGIPK